MTLLLNRKKLLYLLLIAGLVALGIWGVRSWQSGETPLRLHVIANSDSAYDQEVKLIVRDQILDLLTAAMEKADTKEAAMTALNAALPQIEARCNQVLADLAPYGATARLEVAEFPTRRYGGVVLPAGEYDALRVVLGEGAGHNWWCVLFPPLCLVDLAQDKEISGSISGASTPVAGAQVKIKLKWDGLFK